jgi:hypothetical protein
MAGIKEMELLLNLFQGMLHISQVPIFRAAGHPELVKLLDQISSMGVRATVFIPPAMYRIDFFAGLALPFAITSAINSRVKVKIRAMHAGPKI